MSRWTVCTLLLPLLPPPPLPSSHTGHALWKNIKLSANIPQGSSCGLEEAEAEEQKRCQVRTVNGNPSGWASCCIKVRWAGVPTSHCHQNGSYVAVTDVVVVSVIVVSVNDLASVETSSVAAVEG
jgi:hypothetical protein